MLYEVYLDVLFFWNFLLDFLILHQTGLLDTKRRKVSVKKLGRKLLASGIGAMGSILITLLYGLPVFVKFFFSVVVLSFLMVKIGFREKRYRRSPGQFLRQYLIFFGDTLLLGGLVLFLQYQLHLTTFFAVILAGGLTESGICFYIHCRKKQSNLYEVGISYLGTNVFVKALYDTGNRLVCPWNGKPVHIVDAACLPDGEALLGRTEGENLSEGFFYVPFSSVGKEEGLLKATEAGVLRINGEEGELIIRKPIIALGEPSLFVGRPYQMILNCSVFEK